MHFTLKHMVLVAAGGAVGAVARWALGGVILHRISEETRFPVGTLAVNLLGCLIAGILAGLVIRYDLFSADTRLLLFTGVLGGFTTFSAFGVETVALLRRGDIGIAAGYILASVVGGIGVLWAVVAWLARLPESR